MILTDPLIQQDLNPSQVEAVHYGNGPLLIVAGAGTGKTTVLTKRIAHLIASKMAHPNEILALTFTDKAAHEMEERVDKLVPYGFNDVWISTFHSFGDRVLREYAFEIGLSPNLDVLTLPEAVVFVSQHLFEFNFKYYRPLSDPARFVEALLTTFSRAKDEDVTPAEFIRAAKLKMDKAKTPDEKEEAEKNLEAAHAYQTYEELKTKNGFIDFGDQVTLALKIFRERPSVLKKFQNRFKYVLVDEFQDTNYAQFELLKLLAAPHRNMTVVGDDDQSIYKFRGACLSNILGFRKTYPETKEVVLQENYRSTQGILDAAYKLIQHNNPDRLEYCDRISKSLRSHKENGIQVQYTHSDTLFSECEFVVSEIKKRIESGANDPKDFAVLVRTNSSAEPFIKSLNLSGIPWRFSGNAGLYEQEEIRIALSALRTLDQPADSASLYYLAISPLYEINGEDCSFLTQIASKTKRPLYDIFNACAAGEEFGELQISKESWEKIKRLAGDLKRYRNLSSKTSTGHLLYKFFEENGVLKKLAESQDLKSIQQAQNLHKFFEIIKRFGSLCQYDRVHTFIQYVEALRTAGEDPASAEASFEENAVNILTVHAAKGLEFPVVFLAGLEQDRFPSRDRPERIELPNELIKDILPSGNFHIQEERRLFYVGMTRAKDELILCSARDLGKKKMWKISQFILEALDKPQINENALKVSPLDSLKIFASPENPALLAGHALHLPKNFSLPATAVEDYLTCPLKYKFSRILKIPVLMHHTTVFGVAIHEALKAYHTVRKENKSAALDFVLEHFKKAWQSEGFISREHEEKRFQEGTKVLKSYYKKEEASGELPTLVEADFKIEINSVPIRGRFDRVDIKEKESVIIDYKTGDAKDVKDADDKAKKSTQLLLYAHAFRQRFGRLPEKAVLYFIKNGLIGTIQPTDEKVSKTIETTQKVLQGITTNAFEPAPGFHCRWCAFEKICPALNKR